MERELNNHGTINPDEDIDNVKSEIDELSRLMQLENERNKLLEKELDNLERKLKVEYSKRNKLRKARSFHKKRFVEISNSRSWRYMALARASFRLFSHKKKNIGQSNHSDIERKILKEKTLKSSRMMKKADRKIDGLRRKLLNLGFTIKAYEELWDIIKTEQNLYIKRLAAWELLLWHSDKYTKEDAVKCIELIPIACEGEKDPIRLQQAAIMEAECYEILGEKKKARTILKEHVKKGQNVDLFLAYANLVSPGKERINWINKALDLYDISSISFNNDSNLELYDRLESNSTKCLSKVEPKVTVIVPVYNAGDFIKTALDSILSQTWTNIEVIVVDDLSSDNTREIVAEYEKKDDRIKLICANENGGPYVARNLALKEATGEFVTCNDADDWSHSSKIEVQARHLIENTNIVGNTSEQARATNDLKFYRRGKPGGYKFANMSSFMFRRKEVLEKVGYWDSVRFGADSEFIKRIKKVFGDESIVPLETGPLSFQRQTSGSLTGNSAFGYHGYFMGARKEYFEAQNYYHSKAEDLYYSFPQKERSSFAIPEPMLPKRATLNKRRHFDVIIVSDFRLDGGSTLSSLEEIKAQRNSGLRTGLIQMSRYDYDPRKKINPQIREVLDGDKVQMIVYGEKVSCNELILRYPPILQEYQRFIPDVDADEVRVIINQTPMSDYGADGVIRYNLKQSQENLDKYFKAKSTWYPIGPLVREALVQHHSNEIKNINLSDDDWLNIINLNEWKRSTRPDKGDKVRIGRHSRGHETKWPNDRSELLSIYPESDQHEVLILGGGEAPKKVIGYIPENWKVWKFGEMNPKVFLGMLDVFVYYTHPDLVEAFGRVIIEAMAVGVPVIVPNKYRQLFGEAAIYAEPDEVQSIINKLMSNDTLYEELVNKAFDYIERNFGYAKHISRLTNLKI